MSLKAATSDIVNMDEQIDETSYIETDASGNKKLKYVNYITSEDMDIRVVGVDTVTSAMYRLITENYKIYIFLNAEAKNRTVGINFEETSRAQLYNGTEIIGEGQELIELAIGTKYQKTGTNKKLETLEDIENLLMSQSDGGCNLYEAMKGKTFKEYLGEYQKKSLASEEERQTYRIITFVQQ